MPELSRFYGIIIRMYCESGRITHLTSMPTMAMMRPYTDCTP